MVSTVDFIHEARLCKGTPFHHQGRVRGAGLDCIGLVIHTAKACKLDETGFREVPYGRVPDGKSLKAGLASHMDLVWDDEKNLGTSFLPVLQQADVFLLAWKRYPLHVGIAALAPHGWNIIHSLQSCKFVTEHTLDEKWQKNVRAVFRFKEFRKWQAQAES